ncbi:MAG: YidC/Oxa1 family membrane protein insertase [Bacilli bacterium]|nr:YidC/Oxa1 family membrane protein insertase [Bacilli bacterium]
MKNKNKKIRILFLALILILSTGCTKTLNDPETKKAVINPRTGQSLTQNILCQPTDEESIKLYKEYKKIINIEKLPTCNKFSITSGGYDGLWDSLFIKPLAWSIIQIGNFVKSYGLALIITSLLIRMVALPITKKTAIQSELIAKAKPELDRLEKKYENKTDQASMMKKSQEMTMIYKKYNINPIAGCLYAFLQIPLFIAFLESINRVPAIFEENFIGFQLGTTPMIGMQNGNYLYLIIVALVALTTFFSFKLNSTSTDVNGQNGMMNRIMVITITFMSLFMSAALGIYWVTTNMFTVAQNLLVKRSKKING